MFPCLLVLPDSVNLFAGLFVGLFGSCLHAFVYLMQPVLPEFADLFYRGVCFAEFENLNLFLFRGTPA